MDEVDADGQKKTERMMIRSYSFMIIVNKRDGSPGFTGGFLFVHPGRPQRGRAEFD